MTIVTWDYYNKGGKKRFLLDHRMPPPKDLATGILSSPTSNVQAFTLTFRPEFHNIDSRKLHAKSICDIISWLRKVKKDYYCKIMSEYTKNNVLHYHIWHVSENKYVLGLITRKWRKQYGFTYPSKLTNLQTWDQYANGHKTKTVFESNVFKPVELFIHNKLFGYNKLPIVNMSSPMALEFMPKA